MTAPGANLAGPVGYIVSWRVPQAVELKELRAGLLAAGLLADMAPDLKPTSLVARSASYIAKSTSDEHTKKLSRPVGHATRQITREEVSADQLTYTKEMALGLAQDGHTLECDDAQIAKTLPDVAARVSETRTASDVTRIVQQIVSDSGSDLMPVREQGGAYFIPSGHGIITRLNTLLGYIGGELSTFACTIGHGSDESIANTITDYLLKQIGELQESVNELNEKGIRADVKSRRLSRVAQLRERLGAYSTLIQTQGTRLVDALNTAESTLLAKLGSDADEPTSGEVVQ